MPMRDLISVSCMQSNIYQFGKYHLHQAAKESVCNCCAILLRWFIVHYSLLASFSIVHFERKAEIIIIQQVAFKFGDINPPLCKMLQKHNPFSSLICLWVCLPVFWDKIIHSSESMGSMLMCGLVTVVHTMSVWIRTSAAQHSCFEALLLHILLVL